MQTCPNGHQSAYEHWCEVCGNPMRAATSTPAAAAFGYGRPMAGEPTAPVEMCPQCCTQREGVAPFCEVCRYTFPMWSVALHTADAPHPGLAAGNPRMGIPPQRSPSALPQAPFDHHGPRPAWVELPAEPLGHEDGQLLSPPGADQQPYVQHLQQEYQQPSSHRQQQDYASQGQAPSQIGGPWSATVGPDRSYFMAMIQRSPEAVGLNLPAYSPEQHLALSGGQITIGRRRASSGESPDIDLSVPPEDPGVSHQHAMLVQQPDGTWSVMDQNSTNGTTINGGEEPIQPYVPIPLGDGDQVHVGAWTTITVHHGC
ncbi:FHA domain-containing protein [Streptomyces sp. NBC_00513]|uniref:FHA domain-containing protein n=1 Tax=unclassified Streptomyces TaxID=2593676 RepID=UPI00225A9093|nr:FHA domain-containing protein [Streptomyces sp. NBC_00424]MCX5071209.1 FHA domain-containing protein [Streptomyces sp. NBC_00424]WUD45374.1 FHA domain-containing protein [Streptomyces sp. NBC_00513]